VSKRKYSTGDLARELGTTQRTVRYYDELGLLGPAHRTCGGHREFTEDHARRLKLIMALRALGMPLKEVEELATLGTRENPERTQRLDRARALVQAQVEEVKKRLLLLESLQEELADLNEILAHCHSCDSLDKEPRTCGQCPQLQDIPPEHVVRTVLAVHDD
jgi:DNA-binding transcriptional MerR regulator